MPNWVSTIKNPVEGGYYKWLNMHTSGKVPLENTLRILVSKLLFKIHFKARER